MDYALIENGEIKQIGLPETGYLRNGESVSGYDLLPEETLITEGWLPIIGTIPEYNPDTQTLNVSYEIQADKVIATYTVISQ